MASFNKLSTGWQYRVSYKDDDGNYKTKSKNGFRTKSEAQQAAAIVEQQLNVGTIIDEMTNFADYMQNWYEIYKKDKFSVNNNADIEQSINWVKKYFKNTLLKDVTRESYQKFLTWYGDGRATATVRKVHIYASGCLSDAFSQGHIVRNPVWRITVKGTKPKQQDHEKYLNYDESRKLIIEMKKGLKPEWHSRYFILIALATGMRFSEILALNWNDIDLDEGTIDVNKSFDYRKLNQFATTKTPSSIRKIPIDKETVDLLKDFKKNNNPKYENHLFIHESNHGYRHVSNSAVNKVLRKAVKRLKINKITFHSLRHTHCSLLIYNDINIKYISQRLGHSSTDITYKIYGHIISELEDKETDQVRDFLQSLNNAK